MEIEWKYSEYRAIFSSLDNASTSEIDKSIDAAAPASAHDTIEAGQIWLDDHWVILGDDKPVEIAIPELTYLDEESEDCNRSFLSSTPKKEFSPLKVMHNVPESFAPAYNSDEDMFLETESFSTHDSDFCKNDWGTFLIIHFL